MDGAGKPVHVILLGPPGSGKGTQAKLLAQRLGVPAISTGEILRAAVREGTPLGRRVKSVMEAGELVSDDLMIDLIHDRIASPDVRPGFVLDGFPRTVEQAAALDRFLEGNGEDITAVLNMSVPEATLIGRLAGRSDQENRSDDKRETVLERLRVYHEKSEPLVDFYRGRRLLTDVDGVGEVAQITERVGKALDHKRDARGVA